MSRTLAPYEEYGVCGLVANLSGVCEEDSLDSVENINEEMKTRAYEMARIALNHLTAGVVANCPRSVRPCRAGDVQAPWRWTGLTYVPPEWLDSSWLPSCGCTISCACSPRGALDMNTHVAEIVGVHIDGAVLEEDEYWVSEERYLHRVTGSWPISQDMSLPPGEVGTFVVEYRAGWALGPAGEAAYGRLAAEFAKSLCNDGSCSLPRNVKSIVRKGVTMEFKEGLFPDNKTGLRDVDLFVESVNPYALRTVTTVLTPEIRRRQMRTV